MKILIVDDDQVTRTLLSKILTKQGYDVRIANDGLEALELFQTEMFRIVLTDWMMPEMDGPTLCHNIRNLNLNRYIYVILLTAKSAKEDAVTGIESGADDYIIKPFHKHELLARIKAGRRLVEMEDAMRETQLKLLRSEKAAAVGHLSAGIAHEINNPIGFMISNLNALKGYLGDMQKILPCYRNLSQVMNTSISESKLHADLPKLLKQSVKMEETYDIDFLVEDTDGLISDCSDGAERIKSIVHEMRYFIHPEQQSIEPCRLETMLRKAMETHPPHSTINATIDISIEELPEIECNAVHIEQAFFKIIQNAADFVDPNGSITLNGLEKDNTIEITISNSGQSIAPENISKVFDPFYTTKPVGQGLGLGLTTALNIIKMHNGSINATSEPEGMTSFTVRLPVSAP